MVIKKIKSSLRSNILWKLPRSVFVCVCMVPTLRKTIRQKIDSIGTVHPPYILHDLPVLPLQLFHDFAHGLLLTTD